MTDIDAIADTLAGELTSDPENRAAFRTAIVNHALAAAHAAKYLLRAQMSAPFNAATIVNYHMTRLPAGAVPAGSTATIPELTIAAPPFTDPPAPPATP